MYVTGVRRTWYVTVNEPTWDLPIVRTGTCSLPSSLSLLPSLGTCLLLTRQDLFFWTYPSGQIEFALQEKSHCNLASNALLSVTVQQVTLIQLKPVFRVASVDSTPGFKSKKKNLIMGEIKLLLSLCLSLFVCLWLWLCLCLCPCLSVSLTHTHSHSQELIIQFLFKYV